MPEQSRLTKFFAVTKRSAGKYNDFVYDPSKHIAFFSPDETIGDQPGARLITTVEQLRLWYIIPPDSDDRCEEPFEFATNITPLLKSHLQKSIRRRNMSAAIRTAYTMCITSPSDILRRLPIISIEDVELILGTSVIVWLMMTISKRQLTALDIRHVLGYVERLVRTDNTFRHNKTQTFHRDKPTHQTIVSACSGSENACMLSEMLALHYRIAFGGMQGDMQMMQRALEAYLDDTKLTELATSPAAIAPYVPTTFPELMIPSDSDPDFVMASIDFHCYPWMLKKIAEKTGLSQSLVKKLNWFCDSCVNERKTWTKQRAAQNAKTDDWKAIKPHLDRLRLFILSKIEEQVYE